MKTSTSERRKNRSEIPQEAMELYLEAIAARNCLKALALANEDGLLVAGAGARGGVNLDWLAALGPVCAGGRGGDGAIETLVADVTGGEGLFASVVEIGGERLYLASVGAQVPRQGEAAATIQRILAN